MAMQFNHERPKTTVFAKSPKPQTTTIDVLNAYPLVPPLLPRTPNDLTTETPCRLSKMRPPSPHSKFFSSLKQVEKRLKLETPTHPFNSSPAPENIQTGHTLTESLGTPMFIHPEIEPNSHGSASLQESSEPPVAFLSSSPQFPPIHQTLAQDKEQHNPTPIEAQISGVDEIDLLIQLLCLSNCEQGEENEKEDTEFHKIVGVKGPKSREERKRLDGWIRHFLQSAGDEGRQETLSLGYLLLGKAACESENGDSHGGFGGLDFPSAIEEFLKNDPPTD